MGLSNLVLSEYVDRNTICLLALRINRRVVIVSQHDDTSYLYYPTNLLEISIKFYPMFNGTWTCNSIKRAIGKLRPGYV